MLLLQLGGINLSAALLFRLFGGLSTQGTRFHRGKRGVFPLSVGLSAIILTGLLIWQFSSPPNLERSSLAQRANAELQQVVQLSDSAQLVEANVRFTRANIQGQNTLLCVVYVQRQSKATRSAAQIRADLTQAIQMLLAKGFNATPLVDVIVLETPAVKQ